MPLLWPRPERGIRTAASVGSAMKIETPVGINSAAPGARISGASTQARKSMPAEPAVACCGRGNSRPMRGSKIRSLTERCTVTAARGGHAPDRAAGRRRCGACGRRGAGWRQAAGDQGNELARNINFRSARHFELAAGPDDGERIVVAVERNAFADLVG